MIRQLFTLCATGILALAGTADAAPSSSAHEGNGHGVSVQKTRPYRPYNRPYYGRGYYYGRPYYGFGAGAGFATGASLGYLFSSGGYGTRASAHK